MNTYLRWHVSCMIYCGVTMSWCCSSSCNEVIQEFEFFNKELISRSTVLILVTKLQTRLSVLYDENAWRVFVFWEGILNSYTILLCGKNRQLGKSAGWEHNFNFNTTELNSRLVKNIQHVIVLSIMLLVFITMELNAQSQWVLKEYMHRIGKNANEYLGQYVTGIGDFNKDGKPDVAVSKGKPDESPGISLTGIWDISNKNDTIPTKIFQGQNLTIGDINNDGIDDIITAKLITKHTEFDTVFIYLGTANGIDTIPDVILQNKTSGEDYLGYVMAIGDINGDTINDLVITAPQFVGKSGTVYIFFGRSTFIPVPDLTIVGDSIHDGFGYRCKIGDVNNDHKSDLIIAGARQPQSGSQDAYDFLNIYYGGETFDTLLDLQFNGRHGRMSFGGVEIMDANGDGKTDLLWGNKDSSYRHLVRIYFGKSQLDTIPDLILRKPTFSSDFGSSIANAGDMDGDGYNDIAIGDYGAFQNSGFVFIYRGGRALDTLWDAGKGRTDGSKFGFDISSIGDINGDGLSDIIIGAPEYAFGTNQGYFGIFLGDRKITDVKETPSQILPEIATLEQNYPNPFNPTTELRYNISNISNVTLKIYNILGEEIATLVNEKKSPGVYTLPWNASTMHNGIYFYRLTAFTNGGKFYSDIKKMVIVK